jgi:hypothetical protein
MRSGDGEAGANIAPEGVTLAHDWHAPEAIFGEGHLEPHALDIVAGTKCPA